MNAIQPIDVAPPNHAMPMSVSSGIGGAEPGHPFEEVMRSAVSPSQTAETAQRASYPSDSSASSRPQFNRRDISGGTQSNRASARVSTPPSQTAGVKASIRTGNPDVAKVDSSATMSSSAADNHGDASPLVDGQAQASIPPAAAGDRMSEATPQRVRSIDAETGGSPAVNGGKPAYSAKVANRGQGASGSSTIATASSNTLGSVSGIAPNLPVVNPTAATQSGSSAAIKSKIGTKTEDARTLIEDSSLSNPATASALAVRIPHPDGAGTAGVLSHGAQTGDEKYGVTTSLATTTNTTAASATNQNGDPEVSAGSQPSAIADGTSTHASASGISSSSTNADTSNAVGATGAGDPSNVGNDSVGSGGNGAAAPMHGNNGSKSGDFTTAMPTPAMSAKGLPGPHTNSSDSGVGLQNNSSVLSPGSHSGAGGIFSPSAAGSATARATTSDAFTALDSAASGERGVLLQAAPHQVAVGISDPSLGWVEVRAERVSGQIAAALTTSSIASHAVLSSVLPTMATYLQEHHAGVVHQVHVESSVTGGQAGSGSQGQTPSQSDARTSPDNRPPANSASNIWNAASAGQAAIPTSQGTSFFNRGHSFSIRA